MASVVQACERGVVLRVDGVAPQSVRLPTAAERSMIVARQAALEAAAQGCGGSDGAKRRAGVAIAEMLDGFTRSRNLDAAAKRQMVAGFVADMQALPVWAIEQACQRVRRGEVVDLSPDWMPTSARLYQLAAAELGPLRAEQHQLAGVLEMKPRDEPPVDDAARARLAGKFAALKQDLEGNTASDRLRLEAAAREREQCSLDAAAAATQARWPSGAAPMIAGVPVSPELAARLRIGEAPAA